MSWKILLMVARDRTLDDLRQAGFLGDDEPVLGDLAEQEDRPYACQIGDHAVVINGAFHQVDDGLDERLADALQTEVVTAMFFGTTDSYVWRVQAPGAAGEPTRRTLMTMDGEPVLDDGTPLPEEVGLEQLTEDSLADLLQQRTGVALGDWLELPAYPVHDPDAPPSGEPDLFEVHDPRSAAEPAPDVRPRRRGLLSWLRPRH